MKVIKTNEKIKLNSIEIKNTSQTRYVHNSGSHFFDVILYGNKKMLNIMS